MKAMDVFSIYFSHPCEKVILFGREKGISRSYKKNMRFTPLIPFSLNHDPAPLETVFG